MHFLIWKMVYKNRIDMVVVEDQNCLSVFQFLLNLVEIHIHINELI